MGQAHILGSIASVGELCTAVAIANISYGEFLGRRTMTFLPDSRHRSTTSGTVSVTVDQTLTDIDVTPGDAAMMQGDTRQFTATGIDQFGDEMTDPPEFTWALGSGGVGSITLNGGLYTAPTWSIGF
jgi:hypothetical protein